MESANGEGEAVEEQRNHRQQVGFANPLYRSHQLPLGGNIGSVDRVLAIQIAGTQVVQRGDWDLRQTGKTRIAECRTGPDQQYLGCRPRERIMQVVGLGE